MIPIYLILQAPWFMLPAYFANMAPVFCKGTLSSLAKPINSKLFGEHKTWRGIIVAVFFAIIILTDVKGFIITTIGVVVAIIVIMIVLNFLLDIFGKKS